MSIIKHVTLQKTVAHDFRYDPRSTFWGPRAAGSAEAASTPLAFINAYGQAEMFLHLFLTSAENGGDWSASPPGSNSPGKKNSYTDRIENRMGPTVYSGALEMLR